MNLTTLSDQQLDELIKQKSQPKPTSNLSSLSDEELNRLIAEKQPATLSQNIASTVSKGMPMGDILLSQLLPEKEKQAVMTEKVSPVASGISTAAFGAPKALAEALGLKEQIFPEQTTLPGKALRFGTETAGFLGGGAVKTGEKLAEKILPKTAVKTIEEGLLKKAGKAGIQYGTAGLLQTPEQGVSEPIATVPQRIVQGGVGAVSGVGSEVLGDVSSRIGKGIQEYKTAKTNLPKIIEQQGGLKGEQARLKTQSEITSKEIQDYINKLKGKQDIATQYEVRGLKKEVPKLSSDFSKSYGARLKDISSKIDEQGIFNRDVAKDILQKSKDEMVAEGITPSESFNNLYDEFAGGKISKETQPELAALAKKIGVNNLKDSGINLERIDYAQSGIKKAEEVPFTFRDFLNKLDEVKKGVYTQGKAATQIRSKDDLSHIIVQKHLGKFAEDYAPTKEWLNLQKQAAPAIQNIKYAKKLVKPGAPEIPAGAVSAIKKPDIAERDLIKMIQEGIPDFGVKGRGAVTASSAEKGLRIGQAEQAQERIAGKLAKKGTQLSQKQAQLADALAKAQQTIKRGNITKYSVGGLSAAGIGTYMAKRQIYDILYKLLRKE